MPAATAAHVLPTPRLPTGAPAAVNNNDNNNRPRPRVDD